MQFTRKLFNIIRWQREGRIKTYEMFIDSSPEIDDFVECCCDILIQGRQFMMAEL